MDNKKKLKKKLTTLLENDLSAKKITFTEFLRLLPKIHKRKDRIKKFRGQKRYYKRFYKKVKDTYGPDFFTDWFDSWHTHVDWKRYSRISWKHRKSHINALLELFEYFKSQLLISGQEFQLYCSLYLKGSSNDTIHIHTKNPEHDNFPGSFESNPDVKVPSLLRDFLNQSKFEWFTMRWEHEKEIYEHVILYEANTGISIKKASD